MKYVWPVLLVAFGVYGYAALHARKIATTEETCYNRLTDSFLSGRLDIPVDAVPEMTSQPYDFDSYWAEIFRQKLIDYSIYKGKVYPYFSVIPAVLLYLPYRLLFGDRFTDEAATLIFCFGALVWSSLFLAAVREKYYPGASGWMLFVSAGVLASANLALVLVRGATIYAVPLAAGLFFMTGALYFLAGAFAEKPFSARPLFLGSLFLGLAVGSRPNLMLVALALFALIGARLRKEPLGVLRKAAVSALPFAGCLAVLGFYNFLRFGSFLEPGFTYQIMRFNRFLGVIAYDPSRFVANAYFYLFQPPTLEPHFPFVTGAYALPAGVHWPAGSYATGNAVAGLFSGNPFNYLFFLCPLILLARTEGFRAAFSRDGFVAEAAKLIFLYFLGLTLGAALLEGLKASPAATEAARFMIRLRDELPPAIPALLILGWVAVRRARGPAPAETVFPAFEFGLAAACAGMTLLPYLFYMCPALRHSTEFTTYFILAAALVWFYFDSRLSADRGGSWTVRALGVFLATLSSFFGTAYAIHALY